jgi:1-aminocyclopropane-1-carboxylate deaminase/D-cysteine desulfhydrase-like pyridoxal-dependent ACC family enzyme
MSSTGRPEGEHRSAQREGTPVNLDAYARLDALPRERLGFLPTPLVEAPELARAIGVPQLWIKHDELIGFGFGGNKVRGLELLMADARARGADVIVTGAGAQSNHVRATAAAAAHAGMEAVAAYWGEAPEQAQGNLRLTRLLGAQTRFTNSADRAQVDTAIAGIASELRAAGRRPYAIPRGGACALGVLGHVLAARELHRQCASQQLSPGTIFLAVGSGGTLAGWLLGSALLGAEWRIEGVTVSRPADEVRARVVALAAEAAALLGVPAGHCRGRRGGARRSHRCGLWGAHCRWRCGDRACGSGTGVVFRSDLHRQGIGGPHRAGAGWALCRARSAGVPAHRGRAGAVRAGAEGTMKPWGSAAFAPRRVALVGASAEAGKAGRLLLDNLLASGPHEIVPIHPQRQQHRWPCRLRERCRGPWRDRSGGDRDAGRNDPASRPPIARWPAFRWP